MESFRPSPFALRPSRALPARGLRYHWRSSLAVLFGMVVGTAAIAGALVVGDSIRHSLRQMALERLGAVDGALVTPRFIREGFAAELARIKALPEAQGTSRLPEAPPAFSHVAPAILAVGSAENASTKAFARKVNLIGADASFFDLFPAPGGEGAPKLDDRSAILNAELAREIGAKPGDAILLRIERPDPVPAESVAGRKVDRIVTLRLNVASIAEREPFARFGLQPSQQRPLNAWISLPYLQERLEQPGRVNAILASRGSGAAEAASSRPISLEGIATLDEFGLRLRESAASPRVYALESSGMMIPEWAALEAAGEAGESGFEPVITNLAISISTDKGSIPYSTISAVDVAAPDPLGPLKLLDGSPAPALGPDGIYLNQWAADDLGAKEFDRIKVTYFAEAEPGRLETREAEFTLRGVVAIEGLGADPTLTPDYPGVQDAKKMRDWDPPFPVDLSKVRDKDEAYWDERKGTPKAFIAFDRGVELWGSRFGNYTSMRIAVPEGKAPKEFARGFRASLARKLAQGPASDLILRPVRAKALAASAGATDFAGLFIGFSLFIIVAALLLVRLFFALGVERRAKEIGLLMAVGFEPKRVRRLFLLEGVALAAAGAILGSAAGVGYAALMLRGLQTWWSGAIGSAFLSLKVAPVSLAVGAAMGFLCGMLGVWLAVRQLLKAEPARLLAGGATAFAPPNRLAAPSPAARRTASISGAIALGAGVGGMFVSGAAQAGLFYLCGMALLAAALAALSISFKRGAGLPIRPAGAAPLASLGARNAARNPSRSLMTVGLVASASFIIVAVAAYRHAEGKGTIDKDSGNGGFALMAESDVPILHDMNTPEGRAELDLEDAEPALEGARVYPMRLNPGEDASCLNLYRPSNPRVLGAPRAFVERGGFAFQGSLAETPEEKANPWRLLEKPIEDGAIPVVGDFNTVMWILHSGLGKTIEMDSAGGVARLRIVGLLKGSALQSELVVAEENFKRMFPSRAGYQVFFVETPPGRAAAAQAALEPPLRDYGFDAFATQERIDSYFAVENAYLSAFQALGGLGLLLGTLGLSAAMLRNIAERRSELALLRAFGYRGSAVAALVFAENALLLALGLGVGAGAALLAVAPSIATGASGLEWAPLAKTLGAALAFGLASGAIAIRAAVRSPILEALRSP